MACGSVDLKYRRARDARLPAPGAVSRKSRANEGQWPPDGIARDIVLFDLSGKRVYHRPSVAPLLSNISLVGMASGTYCVRVSDAIHSKMKVLVIQ